MRTKLEERLIDRYRLRLNTSFRNWRQGLMFVEPTKIKDTKTKNDGSNNNKKAH